MCAPLGPPPGILFDSCGQCTLRDDMMLREREMAGDGEGANARAASFETTPLDDDASIALRGLEFVL